MTYPRGNGDYAEQLTYLLSLKMADEQIRPPFNRERIVPEILAWPSLLPKDGEELEAHYLRTLNELGHGDGILSLVFREAQSRIQDRAKLRRLIADSWCRTTKLHHVTRRAFHTDDVAPRAPVSP